PSGSSREAALRSARGEFGRSLSRFATVRAKAARRAAGRAGSRRRHEKGAAPEGRASSPPGDSADLEVPRLHHFAVVQDLDAIVARRPAVGFADLEGGLAGA